MKGQHVYYTPTAAAAKLGVHLQTLRRWAEAGMIEYVMTPGGHYRYNVDGFIEGSEARHADRAQKKDSDTNHL